MGFEAAHQDVHLRRRHGVDRERQQQGQPDQFQQIEELPERKGISMGNGAADGNLFHFLTPNAGESITFLCDG